MAGPRILRAARTLATRADRRSPLRRYAAGLGCVLAGWGLRHALNPFLAQQVPWLFFFPAVLGAAWFGRVGPGLLATALSVLLVCLSWVNVFSADAWTSIVGFVAGALLMVWAVELSHRTRRDLELERRFLDTVLSSITDGLVVLDSDWRYTFVNDAGAALSRKPRTELLGRVVWDLHPQLKGTIFEKELERSRREKVPVHFELSLAEADLWLEMRAHPMESSTAVYVTDISARKRVQLDLAQAREELSRYAYDLERLVHDRTAELEDTVGELESFSYTVSHDLRAPLRSMQAFATFILEDYADKLDDRAREYLGRIDKAAQRMDRLIHDLLVYSRLSREETRLHPVELDSLVDEVVTQYRPPGEAQIEIRHPLGKVRANDALLTQAVANLVVNAAKFVEPGQTPEVTIWSEAIDGHVRLFVRDRGLGVPPEARSKVFKMFERAHVGFPGTGIGLAIAKRAVERMRGRIGFDSKIGEGSSFWIELHAA